MEVTADFIYIVHEAARSMQMDISILMVHYMVPHPVSTNMNVHVRTCTC